MRYAFMREHGRAFQVSLMCRVLAVSLSGYYAWLVRPESMHSYQNRQLLVQIHQVYLESRPTYGSPRLTDELRDRGLVCNEKRVALLMRVNDIRAKMARKFRLTTDSKHNLPVAPNLLNRQFVAAGPNMVWLSDITYVWTNEGWLYLAGVIDLYSRRIVGCSMGSRLDDKLTLSALHQALGHRRPEPGLLHHSDQGKQYAANNYQQLLSDHRMIGSMSRKGNCWDNAPMESFFATLKTELIYHERFITREEAKEKIFEYIEVFYNRKRRHSSLGSKSPAEFETTTKPT